MAVKFCFTWVEVCSIPHSYNDTYHSYTSPVLKISICVSYLQCFTKEEIQYWHDGCWFHKFGRVFLILFIVPYWVLSSLCENMLCPVISWVIKPSLIARNSSKLFTIPKKLLLKFILLSIISINYDFIAFSRAQFWPPKPERSLSCCPLLSTRQKKKYFLLFCTCIISHFWQFPITCIVSVFGNILSPFLFEHMGSFLSFSSPWILCKHKWCK